jgi:hypothetical protein
MRGIIIGLSALVFILGWSCDSYAGRTYVRGHFRKNGSYVAPHYRSSPDGNFYNNWSTYGNINPYTGEVGTRKYPSVKRYSRGSGIALYSSSIPDFTLAPVPSKIRGEEYRFRSFAFPLPQIDSILPGSPSYTSPVKQTIPPEVDAFITRRARAAWSNDFSMQAYTIEAQRNGYSKLTYNIRLLCDMGVPREIIEWCLNYSAREWPGDYAMQAYAFDNSAEGYMKLSALLSSDEWKSLPETVSLSILENADATWNDDLSMQAYYVENQIDGFYRISALHESLERIPEDIQSRILSKARSSWPSDLSMQAYTVQNELDGYLKLERLKANSR